MYGIVTEMKHHSNNLEERTKASEAIKNGFMVR
jgi:hypothetical protein